MTGFFGSEVKWVVWDWNGTLLDDVDHSVAVMNRLLTEAGLPGLDLENYREVFDFPVRAYYERLGFDLSGDRWKQLAARFIAEYDAEVRRCMLRDGAREVLQTLAGAGVHCAIVSAARDHSVEALARELGIRHCLREIVGHSDHYAHGKEELGLAWMQRSGADPARTLFVGDTRHDYEVASAMKIGCVLVADGHSSRRRLEACGCPVVGSIRELFGEQLPQSR